MRGKIQILIFIKTLMNSIFYKPLKLSLCTTYWHASHKFAIPVRDDFSITNLLQLLQFYNYIYYTQVDFPEARIYEECLNLMLYENRTEPDHELMQATSWRGAVSGMSSAYGSDDEEERNRIVLRKRHL